MFLFLNASPKLIVTAKTYAHTCHIINNSKIIGYKRKLWETTIFWAESDPCLKKLVILLNLRYLVMSVAPNDSTLIWNLKLLIWNIKLTASYRRKHELHWCHLAFQCSAQWSVEGISYIILLDRYTKTCEWYIEWQRVNEFIV